MKCRSFLLSAAVAIGFYPCALAKISAFSPSSQNDISYSISFPERTASTGSGPVLFQIKAPAEIQWVGLGQGSGMAGADIFVLYSSSSSHNVTISPRSGGGHFEPEYNPDARVTILEGSGIENGIMTANVRCDTCSVSRSWIYAFKEGSPLNSNSVEEGIEFHDGYGITDVDPDTAISTSENPFLQSDANSPAGGETVQVEDDAEASNPMLIAHGFLMSIAFILLFPIFAMLTSFPIPGVITKIHAPLQIFALVVAIAGMGLGIKLGIDGEILDDVHPILGLVVVSLLILFQPAIGLLQHMHFRRTGGKGIFSHLHRWLGRVMIILGIINGGLGFRLAGIGSLETPRSAVIAYSVIASVVGLLYLVVQLFGAVRGRKGGETGHPGERKNPESAPASQHTSIEQQNSS